MALPVPVRGRIAFEKVTFRYPARPEMAALSDLDLVLTKEPSLAASRYLRGLIRIEQGDDRAGRLDILHAKRISPTIELFYQGYGLVPD